MTSDRSLLAVFVPFVLAVAAGRGAAQDWPNWRGPNHDGSTTVDFLPAGFGKDESVRWVTPLPGPGAGTPIIVGERVFVTSIDEEPEQLLALCLDRDTGEVLWKNVAGSGYQPRDSDGELQGSKISRHYRSNYASPSPVTDGERVVFFYGNGDLVAYDLDGEKLWARNLQQDYGDFCYQWTFSTTPTIWEGRMYLQLLQRDEPVSKVGKAGSPSHVLILDPGTGKTLVEHPRPSDAQRESLESYATPIPYVGEGGRKEILIVGGDVITGHHPESGAELWRWGTWNPGHREQWWRVVPSPVVGAGVVLVCAPKRAPVYAVKLDGKGDLGTGGLAWKSAGRPNAVSSDVPTPLYYQERFYVLSDVQQALTCVDPDDGGVIWSTRLEREYLWRASPTGADGRIWCIDHHGDVVVLDADSGEIVHQVSMGTEDEDFVRSTIAIAHGSLFVRTNDRLWCIGE